MDKTIIRYAHDGAWIQRGPAEAVNFYFYILEIVTRLRRQDQSLKRLDLDGNKNPEFRLFMDDLPSLVNALCKSQVVTALYLSNHLLYGDGTRLVAAMVRRNTGIRELKLYSCQITEDGMRAIAHMLKFSDTLQLLNLGWNSKLERVIANFTDALRTNTSLCRLDLSGCLEGAGLVKLCSVVRGKNNIVSLDITSIYLITRAEAEAIAELLLTNRSIKRLILDYNRFTMHDRNIIARALVYNSSIEKISLRKAYGELDWLEKFTFDRIFKRQNEKRKVLFNAWILISKLMIQGKLWNKKQPVLFTFKPFFLKPGILKQEIPLPALPEAIVQGRIFSYVGIRKPVLALKY